MILKVYTSHPPYHLAGTLGNSHAFDVDREC